ncbi:four helix bundle protein [Candidatus Shapirobacteria bacterium]|nr:four helix bundle protein [Candidatus Shapirobacteria bacterium]
MNNTIKSFTDLFSWKESHQLVLMVYKLLRKFPQEEKYALGDQMRRASISITSNIAEGFGRQSIKEKIQFYYLAQGSLTEIKNQLITSRDLGYISGEEYDQIIKQADLAHQILQGLITKTKSYLK